MTREDFYTLDSFNAILNLIRVTRRRFGLDTNLLN